MGIHDRREPSLVALGLLLAGCALPPPENDVKLGAELAASVESEVGLYDPVGLGAYVEELGQRIVAQAPDSPFRYRFVVLDQLEPNAFAAPGGFIFVSRGLLALAVTEDELAGVLGHEITHVEQRHSARRMSRVTLPDLLSVPGRIVGGIVSERLGNMINAPMNTADALSQARYGRSQEAEADRVGQELAAQAGYDPLALASILDRLERFVTTWTGEARRPTFFDSHPPTPARSHDLHEHAVEVAVAPRSAAALEPAAFLAKLDGLLFGPNPAQGEFRDNVFVHPSLDVAIEFPDGWSPVNTPQLAGAIAPGKEAFVFYGNTGPGDAAEVERQAAARRNELQRETGLNPSRDERVEIAGRDAHVLVYTERSSGEIVYLFQVLIAAEGSVHEFLGVGTESAREPVRATLTSLRRLTAEERSSFVAHRIRLVEARAGETIGDVCQRTECAVEAELIASLNGVDPVESLGDGRIVKVVKTEAFP